jgi:hypothetical protein
MNPSDKTPNLRWASGENAGRRGESGVQNDISPQKYGRVNRLSFLLLIQALIMI